MKKTPLLKKKCIACTAQTSPLTKSQIALLLPEVMDWEIKKGELTKTFKFKNYHESMAFVNATAWISHHEDHHPDIELGFNKVIMHYATHSIGGLSENDFICAAKINTLKA